jgi:hypothetical protein
MYATSAPARRLPIGLGRVTPHATQDRRSLPHDGPLLRLPTGYLVEVLVLIAAGAMIGLMVLWGGTVIGRPEAAPWIAAPPLPGVGPLEIDPRDSTVANGGVTPYMERVNTPDWDETP